MKERFHHGWALAPKEAIALQRELAGHVAERDRHGPVTRVAGVDVGFEDNGATTRAAVAVLAYPSLEPVESRLVRRRTRFPYVPGLLSFRELPAILDAVAELSVRPDLFLCDGQGRAHPRRFGIACHLGLWLDVPALGVGKSRLTGTHDEPGQSKGEWTPLTDDGETIGAVVRTRTAVRPVYVSVGHRLSLQSAIEWTLACTTRYRLPETTRAADRLASDRG